MYGPLCFTISEKIKKWKSNKSNIKFSSEDNENNKLLKIISEFGNIYFTYNFEFKCCPSNISDLKMYKLSGEKNNIITKLDSNSYFLFEESPVGVLCNKNLEKNREYRWKIRIIKTMNYNILVGVAPVDFDINKSSMNSYYGWYLSCRNLKLYSGPPHNYKKNKFR